MFTQIMQSKVFIVCANLLFGSSSLLGIAATILIIIGMFGLFRKCGGKTWRAFVPFLRYYELSRCAGREPEGRILFAADMGVILSNLGYILLDTSDSLHTGSLDGITTISTVFLIVNVALYMVLLLYTLRVYLGLFEVFGARKLWIIPVLLLEPVTLLIFGWAKSYQPQWRIEDMEEESAALSGARVAVMDKGLTINLEERSVFSSLRKIYLLRDIHMYIEPGRMVLLLGGSGAGKTTFLNAVNGYEKAKAKVMLNGADVYADYDKMKYEIGFVPQQDLMRGCDTVYRTLDDSALLRLSKDIPPHVRRARVEEVMKIFGLEPVRDSLVEKLSGGQRKRLSIAMEFISNPSLFILDEPDSGLDGVMARELMERLREIANQGKIVIVITHTPDRVIDLFDDVIVLAKDGNRTGRLAFYGPIDEARQFFGRERMEQIVLSVNRQEEGGEGRADEFITKYAEAYSANPEVLYA